MQLLLNKLSSLKNQNYQKNPTKSSLSQIFIGIISTWELKKTY